MFLINPQNEYPRHIGDLKLEHPNWQVGDELPNGWQEVAAGVFPEIPEGKKVVELAPAKVNGVLTRQFKLESFTAEELAYQELSRIKQKVASGEPLTADEAALLVI